MLVDMDGVQADFDAEVLARIALQYPDIPLLTSRKNFYVADDYPEHTELVRSLSDEEGFFDAIPVAEGALEGWERILDYGYHPRVCSSPISTNPTCTTEKLQWLDRHFVPKFGESVIKEAIITKNKHHYDGAALIDDRPEVRNAAEASWQHVIFDKEYNRAAAGVRLVTWLDPLLPDILAVAAEIYQPRN